jgi:hypothetical protein
MLVFTMQTYMLSMLSKITAVSVIVKSLLLDPMKFFVLDLLIVIVS